MAQDSVLSGEALVSALRGGGYNIYFRHAETDWSLSDRVEKPGDWTSCDPARIRQLSDEGRESARAVGKAMRALDIPVGKVLSSPYCRCVETAMFMDLGPVETTTDVINMRVAEYFGGRAAIAVTARALLSTPPPEGANRVIVAHGNVAREATPVYPQEAEGVVFRPDGGGGFTFVGRLTPEEWTALAQALARP
ncbi:MAG: histidine phosphatase family protein [Gammaproteobacteria bacterium]|nr:histidine phosphatase family protein [Gammaproteobacteria bacterium]